MPPPPHEAIALKQPQRSREHALREALRTAQERREALRAARQLPDDEHGPLVPHPLDDLAHRAWLGVDVDGVNATLAANDVYAESLARLRRQGVLVLDGSADADGVRLGLAPHPPGTGTGIEGSFPWMEALVAVDAEHAHRGV